MEENKISRTALGTAYIRAYHAINDTPRIFNDHLACHLLSGQERSAIEQTWAGYIKLADPVRAACCPDRAAALAMSMRVMPTPSITLSRARYTEDHLEEAVRQGVKQYVILGAGLDTFAFRRRDLLERLQVFEVDHPAMQAFKRRRLAELGWELPAKLHFVPVDFTQDSLAAALMVV
jgi:methyltransferase (TIGR00027 family)